MKIDGYEINAYLNVEIAKQLGDTYCFTYSWRGAGDTIAISKTLVEQMLHERTMSGIPIIHSAVFVGPFKLLVLAYAQDTWIMRRIKLEWES